MTPAALRVAIVGGGRGWHATRLQAALLARGHACDLVPVTRLTARVSGSDVTVSGAGTALQDRDAVLVRGIPRGSLEQIVFRVDALHALAAGGVRVVNDAAALERTIDKFLTSALLARAGVAAPATVAAERAADALSAFDALGGDVVLKPLFGAMGTGIVRLDDRDVAERVMRALEIERAVYYLQETVDHGGRDVRALVVGDAVVAAIERTGDGWRTNLARGARARPVVLTADQESLCLRAAAAVGAAYAGVDIARTAAGDDVVLEVNGIPGWQGLQDATGVDVAAALVAALERAVSPA